MMARSLKHTTAMEAFLRSVGIRRVTRLLPVLLIIQSAFWISECKILRSTNLL
jgi:hypothetical protein